jgi:hypothetical protein
MKIATIGGIMALASSTGAARAISLEDLTQRQIQPTTCAAMGTVYRLNPYGDNNLSVREAPSGEAGLEHEKDELFTGEHVRVTRMAGKWAFVIYRRGDRAFSGWVHGRYVHLDGTD